MSNTTQHNDPTSTSRSTTTIFTTKATSCSQQSSSCFHAANALLRSTISAVQNGTISPTDLAHAERSTLSPSHACRKTFCTRLRGVLLEEDDSVALKLRLVHVDVSGSVTWTIGQAEEFVKTMNAIRDGIGEEIPEVLGDGVGLLDDGIGAQVNGGEEPIAEGFSQPLVLRGARPGHDGA